MIARRLFLPLCSVLLSVGATFAAEKPNFSGTWQLDPAKSSFGPGPAPDKMVRKVVQDGDLITTHTTVATPNGDTVSESKYVADGKTETINKTRFGGAKSTAGWKGDSLEVKSSLDFQGTAITSVETWTLGEGGKVMTVKADITTPQGNISTSLLLNKQATDAGK